MNPYYPILSNAMHFPIKSNRKSMNHFLRYILLCIFVPGLVMSCGQSTKSLEAASEEFVVKNFNPLANWKPDQTLYLDYSEAITRGFIIPTARQVEGGSFQLRFMLKNKGTAPQNFRYKIFYQNESYKFPERCR